MAPWRELTAFFERQQVTKLNPMEIGIIGFGRFGRFAAEILSRDFEIFVYDSRDVPRRRRIRRVSFPEVAEKPILLLCVPISEIEAVCRRLKPFLKKGQLVLDTCSVKEEPLQIMTRILPSFVEILGTHPLFGPDSAKGGIRGLKIVLCQIRCRKIGKIKNYLKQLGLDVIVTTAENHDRHMAHTQALFHFLARGVAQMEIRVGTLSTPGPSKLFNDFKDVQNDSKQLFRDLQRFNRFAPAVRRDLIKSLIAIDKDLKAE
jgi:prephenate dehydrogenase